MEAKVISIDNLKGYQVGDEKIGTLRMIKDVLQSKNMKVHQAIFPSKHASSQHSHPESEEICYVAKGRGEVIIGEETKQYGPNSLVFVPSGILHQYRNTGKEEMILIAIYSPPTENPKK